MLRGEGLPGAFPSLSWPFYPAPARPVWSPGPCHRLRPPHHECSQRCWLRSSTAHAHLPHLSPGSQGHSIAHRWTGVCCRCSALNRDHRQPSPEGQSPARRERPPCSQEPSLKRELFHSKASPGIVSEGCRYWPTLPGPDLGPDGAQEEGVGDRAELDQPLPWGASLKAQPCTTPAQSTGQRSRQPSTGAKCVYPPSHRGRRHLPEAETLQAGGTRRPSWEGQAEP